MKKDDSVNLGKITICGANLSGVTSVSFGGKPAEIVRPVRPQWWRLIKLWRLWMSMDRVLTVRATE